MLVLTGFGRFVSDPVLKPVGDTNVCEFTLAVNEYRKVDGERKKYTNFFNFVLWDAAAEVIARHKKKGDPIFVRATPRQEIWSDKETGESRSKIVFRVDEFSFLPRGHVLSEDDD